METKLELKEVLPYLPHKVKVQYLGIVNVSKYHNASFEDNEDNGFGLKVAEIKEIKIYNNYWKAYVGKYHGHLKSCINGYDMKLILHPLSDLTKEQLREQGFFSHIDYLTHEKQNPMKAPYEMIEYLFSQHFDVFGLIDKGLAVDINTL